MYCSYCGTKLKDQTTCPNCGAPVTKETINHNKANEVYVDESKYSSKSKVLAAILALFLGTFGVHNFYLGYTGKAITQILLTTIGSIIIVGPIISSIWSFIEGIMYLLGNNKVDADGKILR